MSSVAHITREQMQKVLDGMDKDTDFELTIWPEDIMDITEEREWHAALCVNGEKEPILKVDTE